MAKSLDELISELFDFSFNNPENKQKVEELGVISPELAQKIKEKTGLDLENYTISIDNYGIRHAMEKHGDPKTETPRGQIAISKEDFCKILEIVENADEITKDGTNQIGQDIILFKKRFEESYTVAKAVRPVKSKKKKKKNRLSFQSFWKSL